VFLGIGVWVRELVGAVLGALIVISIFHVLTLESIENKVGAKGSLLDKLEKWLNNKSGS
jgi:hypothetical protein